MPSEELGETSGRLPRWSLSSIYPDFDSRERSADIAELESTLAALESALIEAADFRVAEGFVARILRPLERCLDLTETLKTHAYAVYSTNTTDPRALEELNHLEHFDVDMRRVRTRFRALLAAENAPAGGPASSTAVATPGSKAGDLPEYRFVLAEEQRLGSLQLSVELEELAADLARSGAELWSRLQDTTGATLSAEWSPQEQKTVVQLRSLAHHPDRGIRRKAYEKELALWRRMEIPLAHAINGVKGFAVSLDGRRGFTTSLERAVIESRMSQDGFDRLISACEEALPIFHRYLKAKAKALGQEKLAFFDIFAPIGGDGRPPASSGDSSEARRFSFGEARALICREMRSFSPDLGAFAESVFDRVWIDAEPRPGKVGGAYCVSFPGVKESRILCNFDGSISSVSTVAHELGHAYHQEVLGEKPALLRQYPMTLAETASIFCETLVYRALLRELPEAQHLTALEAFLQDANQVIVDILSRFRFERELFRLRADHELSPEELCRLMSRFQQEAYGEALDADYLHPYMWAVKGHYYNHDLSFYNFPYAFGFLFSLALLSEYDAGLPDFYRRYRELLVETGAAPVDEVAATLGLDVTTNEFWHRGLGVIEQYVSHFEEQI